MSLERLPKFDSDSSFYVNEKGSYPQHVLLCPNCKGNYLNLIKMKGEYSEKQLDIYFGCELCGEGSKEETFLRITQHKGQTLVEWRKAEVAAMKVTE